MTIFSMALEVGDYWEFIFSTTTAQCSCFSRSLILFTMYALSCHFSNGNTSFVCIMNCWIMIEKLLLEASFLDNCNCSSICNGDIIPWQSCIHLFITLRCPRFLVHSLLISWHSSFLKLYLDRDIFCGLPWYCRQIWHFTHRHSYLRIQ